MRLATVALFILALAVPRSHAARTFEVPKAFAGHYRGIDRRANQGFPRADSTVDLHLDGTGLTLSEYTESGLVWSVHYPPPWLRNGLDDRARPCLDIREAAFSTTPRLQLCFPNRFEILGRRRTELTTFAFPQESLATFVRNGSWRSAGSLDEIYEERFEDRVFGPSPRLYAKPIDLGLARDIMGKTDTDAKIRLLAEAATGLARQDDVEQIQRKYILTMGLNDEDPGVQVATLALVGKFSPTRSAVEFLRERLHAKTDPNFAAAALDLADRLAVEAIKYREPFEVLWTTHGSDDVAEVHRRTGGRVSPSVMEAIRLIERPLPEILRWSEDDRIRLVELLNAYANESEAPPTSRRRARAIALELEATRDAARCRGGLVLISEKF